MCFCSGKYQVPSAFDELKIMAPLNESSTIMFKLQSPRISRILSELVSSSILVCAVLCVTYAVYLALDRHPFHYPVLDFHWHHDAPRVTMDWMVAIASLQH
jgi:hypothetical protein